MRKIGRNSLCPCGSGKKYKRCHGTVSNLEKLNAVIPKMIQRAEAEQVQKQRQQGLGKPIISEIYNGQRFVAVKNRLMYSGKWETFHDFLGDYVRTVLAPEWGNAELAKPPEERHPILEWYQKLCFLQEKYITKPGVVSSMPNTGAAAAYLHLAYDLYSLDHNAELQTKLVARLRNHDNFEGARYEVFVAAMLIRAGFEIEFENEDDRSTSHCEFTATYTKTGNKFSVEAKRRASAKLGMGRLLIKALRKHALHPRIVFIDINLPDDGSEADGTTNMNSSIRKLRGFEDKTIEGMPLPPAYLLVTNTPWQHHLDSTSFRCGVDIDGFKIPDFKANVQTTLRGAIDDREKHIEMHELIKSIQDHSSIPITFDGEIPEFAFNKGIQRLMIGQNYLVCDSNGIERRGTLTSATVNEAENNVYGAFLLDNGEAIITSIPLSELEIAAWRRHPDTFFGEVGQRTTQANSPLELYDFILSSYRNTPKERLLELLAGSPDIAELEKFEQPQLSKIFSERIVSSILKAN